MEVVQSLLTAVALYRSTYDRPLQELTGDHWIQRITFAAHTSGVQSTDTQTRTGSFLHPSGG